MPRLPRISGAEAIRAFEKMGFRQVRQREKSCGPRRGSSGCVIPLNRELKSGTLMGRCVRPS